MKLRSCVLTFAIVGLTAGGSMAQTELKVGDMAL